MKRILTILAVMLVWRCCRAQSEELQQLILNVEKLAQFKQILSDLKKGYEILSGGYNTIKNLSEGNFSLHKAFLDRLQEVSPAVRQYRKTGLIVAGQLQLVKEYKAAYNRFRQDGHFTVDEINYIGTVYENLFGKSTRNLDALLDVVTAQRYRMSDDERIKAIDGIYAAMQDQLSFLRWFNSSTAVLALQRAKDQNDVRSMREVYGIK